MSLPRCFRRSLHKGCDPFGRSRSGSEKMKYSCLHLGSDTTREIRIPDIMSGMSDGAQCVKHRNPSNGGSIGSVSVRLKHSHLAGMVMSGATHISTLYRASFLAENAIGLASRGRLARTRAAVKKHPDYSEHAYFLAVEMAFKQWEAMQNVGSPQRTSEHQ